MSSPASLRLLVFLLGAAAPLASQGSTHGPAHGHLILQGGGPSVAQVDAAFVELAGGPDASFVVIPTAAAPDTDLDAYRARLATRMQEIFGVRAVAVLHATDRRTADSDSFVEPLRHATGVWILGGDEERLVGAYVGTRTEREIRNVLDRGGVVGGTSAGAMIQASFMDTTGLQYTPEIRETVRALGSGGGFGLLSDAFVAPHFRQRGYQKAMIQEMATHPELLGIGIDEGTALIVSGDRADVIGTGTVSMYDAENHAESDPVVLRRGDSYDLAARRRL